MRALAPSYDTFPYADSPFNQENILIDSGSNISLVWNQDLLTYIKPYELKQCTPVGITPLSVHAIVLQSRI